jgi:hypothetical protein
MKNALIAAATVVCAWTAPVPVAAYQIPADISVDPAAVTGGKEALMCLALNDYWEARGESLEGRVAVARVVLNRVADPRYPDSVCGVVHQHMVPELVRACQFSWTCDGRADTPTDENAWRRSLLMAAAVLDAESSIDDPTRGALWYHAASVRPPWVAQLVEATVIGSHTFYRDPPNPPMPLPRPEIEVAEILDETPGPGVSLPAPSHMVDGVIVMANLKHWNATLNGGVEQLAVGW